MKYLETRSASKLMCLKVQANDWLSENFKFALRFDPNQDDRMFDNKAGCVVFFMLSFSLFILMTIAVARAACVAVKVLEPAHTQDLGAVTA
jgi:hypothetical protein